MMLFCYTVGLLVSVAVVRMNGQAAPDPPYAEVAGSPPPTDFGCTIPFDAADLSTLDNRYYYFVGQYLYVVNKIGGAVIGPRRIVDYFSGLTLPVIAAFSVGPLKPYLFIIDSAAAGTEIKIFKFATSTPYPRTVNATSSVATLFPNSSTIPTPITAALTTLTPARVWLFGMSSTTQARSYSYTTAAASFAAMFSNPTQVSRGWVGPTIKAASMWYNATSGANQYFLYDDATNVAQVDTMLQIKYGPVAISNCTAAIPNEMKGCCSPNAPATSPAPAVTQAGQSTAAVQTTAAAVATIGGQTAAPALTTLAGQTVAPAQTTVAGQTAPPPQTTIAGQTAPTAQTTAPGIVGTPVTPPQPAPGATTGSSSNTCPAQPSVFTPQPVCSAAPPAVPYPYANPAATSADKTEILTVHNNYRRTVTATNMQALTWDDCAASNAQAWANSCPNNHDTNNRQVPGFPYCGQNIAFSYASSPLTWTDATTLWYNEVKDFSYCGSNTAPVGHYTQVMWADTARIGCAVKTNCGPITVGGTTIPNANVYVCNYCAGGNINYGGNTVYCPWKQDGPRCSACPSGLTCAPGDCICANNTVTAQTSAPVSSPTVAPQPQTTNAAGATQPGAGTTGAPAQVSTGGAAVTQAPQPTVTGNTPVTQAITTARAANPTTAAGANPITTAAPAAGSCAARVTPTGSPPSCSTSSPPAIQYTYTAATPSSTEIGEILTAHNNYRRNISATDMRALKWNDCAASNAQYWANQCVFGHDQNSRVIPGFSGCGQNLFASTVPLSWTAAVDAWYSEVKDFTFCSASNDFLKVGHYTQVMWAKTSVVGCGSKFCPALQYPYQYFCNYCEPGNAGGVPAQYCPYTPGTRCTGCPTANPCPSGDCLCT